MISEQWMTLPGLAGIPGMVHAFTLRHPDIEVATDRETAIGRLTSWHQEVARKLGFDPARMITADQVHGNRVEVVTAATVSPVVATDGLVTNLVDTLLAIYVADCCAVYLVDQGTGAFGVLHSGKKGSESGIVAEAIGLMKDRYGSRPEDILVELSPCIRPPAYEVDFAGMIKESAREAGVPAVQIHDQGICTSSDLRLFYSYRVEKGKTGRMLALIGRRAEILN